VVTTHRDENTSPLALLARDDTLELAAGAHVERDFDLVVPMKPVSGRVVRASADSTESLLIVFVDAQQGSEHYRKRILTEADGRFELELPDVGIAYRASVSVDEREFTRDDIHAGDHGVEILIHAVPAVFVLPLDTHTRAPLAQLELFARRHGEAHYQSVVCWQDPHVEGGWIRALLDPGTYDLLARAAALGYAPTARAAVLVPSSGELRIELEMQRGATLELRLAKAAAKWAPAHAIALLEEDTALALEKLAQPTPRLADFNPRHPGVDPATEREVDFAQHDVVVIRGLAPGRYRLFDAARKLVFMPEMIEVKGPDSAAVELEWRSR
jgi:hypothetical protein